MEREKEKTTLRVPERSRKQQQRQEVLPGPRVPVSLWDYCLLCPVCWRLRCWPLSHQGPSRLACETTLAPFAP